MILRPDAEPEWPQGWTLVSVLICIVLLIIYSYALKPLGFLIPTALVPGAISYQILPKAKLAAVTGVGL